jgi:hypothetical protein
MLYNSTPSRGGQPSRARQVLLTWARAREYKDLATRYLRLANSASDRSIRDRYILIARHYSTLADAERRFADESRQQPGCHPQDALGVSFARSLASVRLVLFLLISAATYVAFTTFPSDVARAEECLAAPNGPAPQGKHWYYHQNRVTQQKCWYVRASGAQAQQAANPKTSSGDGAPISLSHGRITPSATQSTVRSLRAKTSPIKLTSGIVADAAQDQVIAPSRAEETTAAAPDAASQEGKSSAISDEAVSIQPSARSDPSATAGESRIDEASAATTDVGVNLVSSESAPVIGEHANSLRVPIIIFPALALGLVVMGIGSRIVVRSAAGHRARAIESAQASAGADENRSELPRTGCESGIVQEDQEFHSFVAAMSDDSSFEAASSANRPSDAIEAREARLARLCNDIDRKLGRSTPKRTAQSRELVGASGAWLEAILNCPSNRMT